MRQLAARTIKGYFVVPPDYIEKGVIDVYTPDTFSVSGSESRNAFSSLIRERLVTGRLDEQTTARVVSPLKETRRFSVTKTGDLTDGSQAAGAVRFAVPLIFTVLFLMSVLMTSGYLMQGTATEKENKVVDVLLASAGPDEILAGKLLGLGGAGLLQIAVWLLILLVGGIGIVPLLMTSQIEMPWVALALAIPLFLVAFLFFGSLMLGTGSLGSNMREAQQLAMVWSLTAALPMMMMAVLVREPHGTVARVMTWLPFSAGPLIMFRASIDLESLAWWEVAGSFCRPAAVYLAGHPHRGPAVPHRPSELVTTQAERDHAAGEVVGIESAVESQSLVSVGSPVVSPIADRIPPTRTATETNDCDSRPRLPTAD